MGISIRQITSFLAGKEEPKSANPANGRTIGRHSASFNATISTIGPGGSRMTAKATGRDINDYGVMLTSRKFFPPDTPIVVTIESHQLMGIGKVRHCKKGTFQNQIGVQFSGPLRRAEIGSWTVQSARM